MYLKNAKKYGKPLKVIHAGEFYVSDRDELIQTLLGSCVAVCLYDGKKQIAGMNHFMLPGRISKVDIFSDRSARYGIAAVNDLIEAMVERGAEKRNLVAKIFGGGSVLEYRHKTKFIPDDNVRVARVMLEIADIQIKEQNTGGKYSRKVVMDVKSGDVFCKQSENTKVFHEEMGATAEA